MKGIFQYAHIVRGSDWKWGNQDGIMLCLCLIRFSALLYSKILHFRWNWNTWRSCCHKRLAKRKHGIYTVEFDTLTMILLHNLAEKCCRSTVEG